MQQNGEQRMHIKCIIDALVYAFHLLHAATENDGKFGLFTQACCFINWLSV